MSARSCRVLSVLIASTLAACSSDGVSPTASLAPGQSLKVTGAQDVKLDGGSSGAQYFVVLANNNTSPSASESYTIVGKGITASVGDLLPQGGASLSVTPFGGASSAAPVPDVAFETHLRARERAILTPLIPRARAWMAQRNASTTSLGSYSVTRRNGAVPSGVKVGDTVTVNVNGTDACDNPDYRGARVVAIGTHSIVLADTSNPSGGFSDADYQRYATRFDTLVYPLDTDAFGTPSDIDQNGHVVLIFTTAVNELTPPNADSFVGGFTFSRDLFPRDSTARLPACATSNVGEYFYLLAPDPLGQINGNERSAGFVDTMTTGVIAHEFQHLINSSRRIYVNNANDFEDTWLDEGLSHIAEELLFYREAGLGPKQNIDTPMIRASEQRRTAFNLDMVGNAGRYRSYLLKPSSSSPYADNDSLPTRGGAWDLLRYLADQRSTTGDKAFYQLVNTTLTGIANVEKVFGSTFPQDVRDWNVSHAVDDVAAVSTELTQPSWNWHSIFPVLYPTSGYPLKYQVMTDATPYSGTVMGGGASYYKLTVPANGSATVSVGGQSASSGSHLQLVAVRIQ